jgi:hypothetical protein
MLGLGYADIQVHVRALVISGQNHVFNFEPELTVGRMVSTAFLSGNWVLLEQIGEQG